MREDSFTVVVTDDHPVANCVDLRQTFAGQYRFALDEAYEAELPEQRGLERAWLTFIPCKFGQIFPYGGRRLAASASNWFRRRQLEALPEVTGVQGGGPGSVDVTVVFDVADIETVAAVLGARRPRQLSEAHRARLRARMLEVRRHLPGKKASSSPLEPRSASSRGQKPTSSSASVSQPQTVALTGDRQ